MNICILDRKKDEIKIIEHNLYDLLVFLDNLNNKYLSKEENKLNCNNDNLFTGFLIQTTVFKDVINSFISTVGKVEYEYFVHYLTVNMIQYLFGIFNLFEADISNIYEQVFNKLLKEKHSIIFFKEENRKYFNVKEQVEFNLDLDKVRKYKIPAERKLRLLYSNMNKKFNGGIQEKFQLLSKMRNHLYHANKSVDLNQTDINTFKNYLLKHFEITDFEIEEILNVSINEKKHFCFSTTFYNYKYFIDFFIHIFLEIYADLQNFYKLNYVDTEIS